MHITKEQIESFIQNEVFQQVVTAVRLDALEALATVDPNDTNEIIRNQMKVALIQDLQWVTDSILGQPDEAEDSEE